ncbi:hypothetical protein ACX3VT_01310 [Aerococcus sanguinicola]|uniref:hypothetical protein n=1 Tax=unclassified Aerococcus TaxID=2618060 RepID=UPI0008A4F3C0|nr:MULTISPECIES: hypothetical protein [unclassified Aerococcus]MDK6856161.1 hypothetical protein [Aerococcus sp. UMB7533]OFN02427.1 hypothetical protein HMPREF2626_06175 [Aerococcus sp. HMSC062A02]OHO45148.1 hypothetical protein HMPREF2705_00980 [Aerococcus sp. HMSC035B07]
MENNLTSSQCKALGQRLRELQIMIEQQLLIDELGLLAIGESESYNQRLATSLEESNKNFIEFLSDFNEDFTNILLVLDFCDDLKELPEFLERLGIKKDL